MVPLFCVVIAGLCGLVVSAPAPEETEFYTTKYDHVDVEMILNNRRLVNYYTACMLSQGPCPPEGLELKRILPDALKTNCKRCTDKQKATTLRTIKRLMKEYPKTWALLKAEWDPEDKYVKLFITTYSNWTRIPEPVTPMIIFDRFGDEDTSESPKPDNDTSQEPSQTTSSTTPRVWLPPIPPLNPNPGYNPLANSIGQGLRATGAEAWTMNLSAMRRLEAIEKWVFRRLQKIQWTDHELFNIIKRKVSYLEHTYRGRHYEPLRLFMEGKIKESRDLRRRRFSWLKQLL